jgi:hypothetical protein
MNHKKKRKATYMWRAIFSILIAVFKQPLVPSLVAPAVGSVVVSQSTQPNNSAVALKIQVGTHLHPPHPARYPNPLLG